MTDNGNFIIDFQFENVSLNFRICWLILYIKQLICNSCAFKLLYQVENWDTLNKQVMMIPGKI